MSYKYLDLDRYKRKDHFAYFSSLSYPYVGVTADVKITDFAAKVKEKGLPFFLSFCYCAARAANAVPEFRQRIVSGKIIEYDNCRTSHTVALDDGTYCYCTLDSRMPFAVYLPYAVRTQEKAKEARTATDNDDDVNELIFISTLPWLSYTSLVQPTPMPADSNPRITWGKFVKQDSVIRIPVTVLCNHALVDGYHISQFYDILGQQLKKLTDDIN